MIQRADTPFAESTLTIGGEAEHRKSLMTDKGSIDIIAQKIVEKL